ncbi:MAG TPA: pre-peptidase C-terminal domain-containing protein, partial [Nannocystis sp.]
MLHLLRPVPALLIALAPLAGCDSPDTDAGARAVTEYREVWGTQDNPSLLDPGFNYTFAQLPTSGAAKKTPWTGSYWPTYQDSINMRWAGAASQSAARKYELAFGKTGVEDAVSAASGIDSLAGAACTSDAQCDAGKGSVCAKRAGSSEGTCSETWFGLCHAWAPAAILEDEPKLPVTVNGVEFKVNDLKALMSLAYTDALDVKFMSLRCDDSAKTGDLTGKAACKDTNAGSFHVVVANLLGIQGKAFVEDRTYDYEVWNQPVRSFKVTKNVALTPTQANQLLGAGKTLSAADRAGSVAASAWTQVYNLAVKPGQTLRVRMTGTGDADLYLRWNAQPTATTHSCRPYLEGSDELCELVVPADAKTAYIAVNGYAPTSQYKITTTLIDLAPATYAYNPAAVSLRQIQTELRWIGESASTTDGNLSAVIDQYTQKDV